MGQGDSFTAQAAATGAELRLLPVSDHTTTVPGSGTGWAAVAARKRVMVEDITPGLQVWKLELGSRGAWLPRRGLASTLGQKVF